MDILLSGSCVFALKVHIALQVLSCFYVNYFCCQHDSTSPLVHLPDRKVLDNSTRRENITFKNNDKASNFHGNGLPMLMQSYAYQNG